MKYQDLFSLIKKEMSSATNSAWYFKNKFRYTCTLVHDHSSLDKSLSVHFNRRNMKSLIGLEMDILLMNCTPEMHYVLILVGMYCKNSAGQDLRSLCKVNSVLALYRGNSIKQLPRGMAHFGCLREVAAQLRYSLTGTFVI